MKGDLTHVTSDRNGSQRYVRTAIGRHRRSGGIREQVRRSRGGRRRLSGELGEGRELLQTTARLYLGTITPWYRGQPRVSQRCDLGIGQPLPTGPGRLSPGGTREHCRVTAPVQKVGCAEHLRKLTSDWTEIDGGLPWWPRAEHAERLRDEN